MSIRLELIEVTKTALSHHFANVPLWHFADGHRRCSSQQMSEVDLTDPQAGLISRNCQALSDEIQGLAKICIARAKHYILAAMPSTDCEASLDRAKTALPIFRLHSSGGQSNKWKISGPD